MRVIGTAGHVDHGKSTLVKAMTGMDPDRLREEQERGLTIDLGFAWMTLPDGEEVSIVDVPGHERFVGNMLAGVGAIDMALLVVAADESVMPQTREHLAILDLLQINRGLVAITKADLVDGDWLALVAADVAKTLRGTTLEGAKAVPVSAVSGSGMPDLLAAIQGVLKESQPRKDLGRPRLSIDRSFTISGFGTVVTGTLIDGRLKPGQEIEVLPSGAQGRIRGLQTNKSKLDEALPGRRLAVNISGVDHDRLKRGDVLTSPGWLRPTIAVDVRFQAIAGLPRPVRHNLNVTVHAGSSEVMGRLRLLDTDAVDPGASAWAQLKLDAPLTVVKGDHYVVRAGGATIGGGSIVVPHAVRHQRMHAPTIERLAVMERGTDREVLVNAMQASEPAEFGAVARRANLSPEQAALELDALVSEGLVVPAGQQRTGAGAMFYTLGGWNAVCDTARQALAAYHRQFPLRKGAPREELRSRLNLTAQIFANVLPMLVERGVVADDGVSVRLPEHQPKLSAAQEKQATEYMKMLLENPYAPPTDSTPDEGVLGVLADRGDVVRVSESVAFSKDAYEDMVRKIRGHITEKGRITVADVRDLFGTSRKYALALMEHLDRERVTRRVDDVRVLR